MPRSSRATGRAASAMVAVAASLALAGPAEAELDPDPGPDPAAVPAPFDRKGMWVWYVSRSGGSAKAIARKASRRGLDTVYVKSGDASRYWAQFNRRLVRRLHRAGVRACAWQFVYGARPAAEARTAARAAEAGADCLVIDAESAYEGRYAAADRYLRRLRALVGPGFPLGLSSFPFVDYHPAFPYSVFMRPGGATVNLPQMYWRTIGVTVPRVYGHTFRFNRPYGTPISPVGQTYLQPPKPELIEFRRYSWEYGGGAASWWSWQETGRREFRVVTRPIRRRVDGFEAPTLYPRLRRGSAGDLVVRAEELMRAWDYGVQVDGYYGNRFAEKVADFQAGHGIVPSGEITRPTWQALMKREPESVRWSRLRAPASSAGGPRGGAPASAALPALGNELAGRPRR